MHTFTFKLYCYLVSLFILARTMDHFGNLKVFYKSLFKVPIPIRTMRRLLYRVHTPQVFILILPRQGTFFGCVLTLTHSPPLSSSSSLSWKPVCFTRINHSTWEVDFYIVPPPQACYWLWEWGSKNYKRGPVLTTKWGDRWVKGEQGLLSLPT